VRVGVGSSIFSAFGIGSLFGIGLAFGIPPFDNQSFGIPT
jgi:hypothetical protein